MRENTIFDSVKVFKEYIFNPESGFNAKDHGEDILESCFTPDKKKVSLISFKTAAGDEINVYYFSDESGFWKVDINTSNTSLKINCNKRWIRFGYDHGIDCLSCDHEEGYNSKDPKYKIGWVAVVTPGEINSYKVTIESEVKLEGFYF